VTSLNEAELREISRRTLDHYQSRAQAFWEGTRDHDVSQNVDALLAALPGDGPQRILDFGCGPGRDLLELQRRGHDPVGLDGCAAFVEQARALSGARVLHQDFLQLRLPEAGFDGVFANASLFHVPRQELPGVLRALFAALRPDGALFSSNPRGSDEEGFVGERYGVYHADERWFQWVSAAGFELLDSYHRPAGLPPSQQPWLASVWRRP
jgi:SAM-dependent methyltransferase